MNEVRRNATASVYFEWAIDPYSASATHVALFGKAATPITEKMVRDKFGEVAADAWVTARKSKSDFFAAILAAAAQEAGNV